MIQKLLIASSAVRESENLGCEGLGILLYVSRFSDEWIFHRENIYKDLKMTHNTYDKYMKGLEMSGWIKKTLIRDKKDRKKRAGIKITLIDKYGVTEGIPKNNENPKIGQVDSSLYLSNICFDNTLISNDFENINKEKDNIERKNIKKETETPKQAKEPLKNKYLGSDIETIYNAYPDRNIKGMCQRIKKTNEDAERISDFLMKNNITCEGLIQVIKAYIGYYDAIDSHYTSLSMFIDYLERKFKRCGSADKIVAEIQADIEKEVETHKTGKWSEEIERLLAYIPQKYDRSKDDKFAMYNLIEKNGLDDVEYQFKNGKYQMRNTALSCISFLMNYNGSLQTRPLL